MVTKKDNIYECDACHLKYKNKAIAIKCEAWCKKTNSCNLDIIKYAIK